MQKKCNNNLCAFYPKIKPGDVIAGLLGAAIGVVAICAFIGWKSGRVEMQSTGYEETDDFEQ